MEEIKYYSPGETLVKYSKMSEEEIRFLRKKWKTENLRCSICKETLIVAALGPHTDDDENGYKRHPFIRVKNSHIPGFKCHQTNGDKRSYNTDSESVKESMRSALERITSFDVDDINDPKIKPTDSKKRVRKGSYSYSDSESNKRIRVNKLPNDLDKVKIGRIYSFKGTMTVDRREKGDKIYENIYFRSYNDKLNYNFSFKTREGMPLRDEIINSNISSGTKMKIACVFLLDKIQDGYIAFWPNNLSNIMTNYKAMNSGDK